MKVAMPKSFPMKSTHGPSSAASLPIKSFSMDRSRARDWLFYALDAGSYVNLDSKREIEWVREYAESGKSARVGLRANILLEKHCPGETLSDDRHGRFGFSFEGGELARPSRSCEAFRASSCADSTCM